MLYKYLGVLVGVLSVGLLTTTPSEASFGQRLCKSPHYECLRVKSGESWFSLFPNERDRLIVKKINRMNTPIHGGMIIAVPRYLSGNVMDYAPFPHNIGATGYNSIKVNLGNLAWGAYNGAGQLVNWGPASGGKSYCPDVGRGCRTISGNFTVYSKKGPGCKSSRFPLPRGGAPMPYCMHFHGGFALHGSPTVPGYSASHGCVRLFVEDALWLNQSFVNVGRTKVNVHY